MNNDKNMSALNEALHRQLSRLEDPTLDKEGLRLELDRTDAITDVSKQIIDNGRLLLDASIAGTHSIGVLNKPKMLEG